MIQQSIQTFKSSALAKNITKVYGGDVISKLIGISTTLLIIRGLSVNDYAVFIAFTSILMFIPDLVGNGINLALVRYSTEHISNTGERPIELYVISFLFQFVLYFTLGVVVLLLSDKVTFLLFGQKDYGIALRYGLIGGVGWLITQAGRGVYQAEEKFVSYIRTLWLRQLLLFIIILPLFLLKHLDYERTFYATIIAELTVASIVVFHIFHDVRIGKVVLFFKEQFGVIKEFISSTGWLIAYFFTLGSFQRFDIFMLSHMTAENELANYGVASRYYSMALMVLSSIHAVLLPRFSKVDMQDINRQRQFTYKWMKIAVWIIIPILIFDIFGKQLFVMVNGAQYEKAFYVFVIFSIGVWLSLMFSPLVNILIARKSFKFLFVIGLGAFAINFTGNYFLIPVWGGFGAAIVTILSQNVFLQGLILIKLFRSNRNETI